MDELRFAVRRLMKRPGAAIVSVVTLALSIGAATATWSLLSAVLLHPLPVPAPDRLVAVGVAPAQGTRSTTVSTAFIYPVVPAIRDSGVFRDVTFGGSQSGRDGQLLRDDRRARRAGTRPHGCGRPARRGARGDRC